MSDHKKSWLEFRFIIIVCRIFQKYYNQLTYKSTLYVVVVLSLSGSQCVLF